MSSDAREEILRRIQRALRDQTPPPPAPREYHQASGAAGDLDLFAERLIDYRAVVRRCTAAEVPATLAGALRDRGATRVVVPPGFPAGWLAALDGHAVADDPPLATAALDELDGVVTTCAVAVAETGSIVLDAGPGQGRRALSLVPDYHLAVVRADQVVAAVPDAIAALDPTRPLTWISGPSATSNIELDRVEGVHGPRTLEVILVAGSDDGHQDVVLAAARSDCCAVAAARRTNRLILGSCEKCSTCPRLRSHPAPQNLMDSRSGSSELVAGRPGWVAGPARRGQARVVK